MNLIQIFELGMKRSITPPREQPEGVQLNLGTGRQLIFGAVSLDYPLWDADKDPIPYGDGTIACVHAYHFLEHCKNPIAVLREIQRVLIPWGVVNIVVPYYSSQLQATDLDHKHAFCEETWKTLFNNEYYDKDKEDWQFTIGTNVIMGVVERNLALVTQLIKVVK